MRRIGRQDTNNTKLISSGLLRPSDLITPKSLTTGDTQRGELGEAPLSLETPSVFKI